MGSAPSSTTTFELRAGLPRSFSALELWPVPWQYALLIATDLDPNENVSPKRLVADRTRGQFDQCAGPLLTAAHHERGYSADKRAPDFPLSTHHRIPLERYGQDGRFARLVPAGRDNTHSANQRARLLPGVSGIRAAWSFAIILANADHRFGLCLGAYGLSHPPLKRFTRDAKYLWPLSPHQSLSIFQR